MQLACRSCINILIDSSIFTCNYLRMHKHTHSCYLDKTRIEHNVNPIAVLHNHAGSELDLLSSVPVKIAEFVGQV